MLFGFSFIWNGGENCWPPKLKSPFWGGLILWFIWNGGELCSAPKLKSPFWGGLIPWTWFGEFWSYLKNVKFSPFWGLLLLGELLGLRWKGYSWWRFGLIIKLFPCYWKWRLPTKTWFCTGEPVDGLNCWENPT